jgi:glutamate-ammonia-ligase adenylyltransferase
MSESDVRSAGTTAIERISRSLSDFLHSDGRAAQLLAEQTVPDADGFLDAMSLAVTAGGMSELRIEKRRRLLQIAALDASGRLSLEEIGRALSDLADASLQATFAYIEAPDGLSVVSMGKLGARELNYFSDIDVMFVASGDIKRATRAAETLITELGGNSPEGQAYSIDANLRPQGRTGALVRSLDAFLEYYRRWAESWEFQALLKARASAGQLQLGQELVDKTRSFVFPDEVTPEHIASIRSMRSASSSMSCVPRVARRAAKPTT